MKSDMDSETVSAERISSLLEQLARRMHSQGYAARLFPAQWAALRYVNSAPDHLRTAIDLARFQGLASGAVARTVRTLIRKGFLEKQGTIGRGRAERLALTEKGRVLLKRDPLSGIVEAVEMLEDAERQTLQRSLQLLLRSTGGPIDDAEKPSD
ncbi:DNA-binding transcriptional regulator, MarR family [Fulvimarina manganoxydans]|uniref:DNA-binding transcriptional regulator, MarR family n=1 Tax=Fulvimarina manganoxydans TaxID=937218 RepID=A0A1W1YJ70_9HYPH|nr:MarR family winged helix-turn-helix transcriptional regulator [Fulvimarina manganoxydans]SMC36225.1 DNA-binding transcriptional regulator, MarR family [Fulvimarina manganoxydans]